MNIISQQLKEIGPSEYEEQPLSAGIVSPGIHGNQLNLVRRLNLNIEFNSNSVLFIFQDKLRMRFLHHLNLINLDFRGISVLKVIY